MYLVNNIPNMEIFGQSSTEAVNMEDTRLLFQDFHILCYVHSTSRIWYAFPQDTLHIAIPFNLIRSAR